MMHPRTQAVIEATKAVRVAKRQTEKPAKNKDIPTNAKSKKTNIKTSVI